MIQPTVQTPALDARETSVTSPPPSPIVKEPQTAPQNILNAGLKTPPRGRLAPFMNNKHPAARALLTQGWAIMRICHEQDAKDLAAGQWTDLESLGTGINRNDPKTWTNEQWPQTTHGLLQNQGVGLWEGVCQARLKTWTFWKAIFGNADIICSFDAVSIARPDSQKRAWNKERVHQANSNESKLLASWAHTDQAKAKTQCLHHIQGALALTSLGEAEQRTQLVVPPEGETMQSFRDRFLAEFPPSAPIKGKFDPERAEWVMHSTAERAWLIENGRIIAPTLEPGEMLLWDSGMPHASIPGPLPGYGQAERAVRMSTFVSALPIQLVDAADIAVRKQMLEKGVTSGHRVTAKGTNKPYLECKFANTGRTFGKALPSFKMDRKVSGFKRAFEEGDTESTAYKIAKMCGGY